jgi:hypothetical protein
MFDPDGRINRHGDAATSSIAARVLPPFARLFNAVSARQRRVVELTRIFLPLIIACKADGS